MSCRELGNGDKSLTQIYCRRAEVRECFRGAHRLKQKLKGIEDRWPAEPSAHAMTES